MRIKKLARKFAEIVGGEVVSASDNTFDVTIERNLHAKIKHIHLETEHEISVTVDGDDRALNTGEFVLLQHEVNPFISSVRKESLLVTAVHNHWLFEKPRLMYVHVEAVENPLMFAKQIRKALKALEH